MHCDGTALAAKMLMPLLNPNLIMKRNLDDHFLLVDRMGLVHHLYSDVGPWENGTKRSQLYFQAVMSFPCVLTNPLHQHLSHGEEGVQRKTAWNRPKNSLFLFFIQYIYFSPVLLRLHTFHPCKHTIFYEWEWLKRGVNMYVWWSGWKHRGEKMFF